MRHGQEHLFDESSTFAMSHFEVNLRLFRLLLGQGQRQNATKSYQVMAEFLEISVAFVNIISLSTQSDDVRFP